ncbi:hypothetical protein [Deinococcus misasensis]|uniref:hypothetical protein n=1 Tax=Deinococcus misasensis TaxID=392413 RepID=UPI00054D06B5|nr:hypothetical protein [Deinococcus misasensis]
MKIPIVTLAALTVATAVEGGVPTPHTVFEMNAGDLRVLLTLTLAVGFVHWLKWLSEPRSRRGHPTKLVGDIGVAMVLFWAFAAILQLWGKLNMPYLIITAVAVGMFKKDFQSKFRTWVLSLFDEKKAGGSS